MKIHGTFLCISRDREPEVHLLSETVLAQFNERLRLASMRESDKARAHAYRITFGKAFDYAVPCWVQAAMERIAFEYEGAHKERVRHLAASIALGEGYGGPEGDDDTSESDDSEGGQRVKADPKPTKPRPGGTAVSLASMFADARS